MVLTRTQTYLNVSQHVNIPSVGEILFMLSLCGLNRLFRQFIKSSCSDNIHFHKIVKRFGHEKLKSKGPTVKIFEPELDLNTRSCLSYVALAENENLTHTWRFSVQTVKKRA